MTSRRTAGRADGPAGDPPDHRPAVPAPARRPRGRAADGKASAAWPVTGEWPPITPSSALVSQRMSVLPRRDTSPELRLRTALHARGLRYRVCLKVPALTRRTIDIAFTRAKIAVFVDGC